MMSKLVWICARKCGKMALETGVAGRGGDTEENMALASYSFHPGEGRCSFGEGLFKENDLSSNCFTLFLIP